VPETEPARSHYKELVEAKANVRACQVLQDIGQGMLETQLEAVNNVATEDDYGGLGRISKRRSSYQFRRLSVPTSRRSKFSFEGLRCSTDWGPATYRA